MASAGAAMDLNHLHIVSPRIEESVAFYRDFFDFHDCEKLESGSYFIRNHDGFMIAIGQTGETVAMPKWFHFGFRLRSVAAVEKCRERLGQAGHKILEEIARYPDFVTFRCADPAGFEIEVYWEPTPEA